MSASLKSSNRAFLIAILQKVQMTTAELIEKFGRDTFLECSKDLTRLGLLAKKSVAGGLSDRWYIPGSKKREAQDYIATLKSLKGEHSAHPYIEKRLARVDKVLKVLGDKQPHSVEEILFLGFQGDPTNYRTLHIAILKIANSLHQSGVVEKIKLPRKGRPKGTPYVYWVVKDEKA